MRAAIALLGVLAAAVLVTAGPAAASGPDNDDFANARVLTEPTVFNESQLTQGATAEPGEPAHGGRPAEATVWYRWTAPADVVVTAWSSLTLLGSDRTPAHALAFYTGDTLPTLQEVVSAEGTDPGVTFRATAGTVYDIVIDVRQRVAADGNTHLFLYASPPNDDFADATVVSGGSGSADGYVATATLEGGEPQHSLFDAFGGTVWYDWTAPTTGFTRFGIECCAGNQPAIAVYTGSSLSDLHAVASGFGCQVGAFNVCTVLHHTRGTTYHVAVQGDGTRFPLRWALVSHRCTMEGTAGPDVLVGTSGRDRICGRGGNDVIRGLGGDDVVVGGPGSDVVDYSDAPGAVEVDLTKAAAFDGGANTLDTVEDVTGSRFDDTLTGDVGSNRVIGGRGNDRLAGRGGADRLFGGSGRDSLVPGAGDDRAKAGAGIDEVDYTDARRPIDIDLRTGTATGQGTDHLDGFEDVLGSAHRDHLVGDSGTNFLLGGSGRDLLEGHAGDDSLFGQDGNDTLKGGHGTDACRGGPGTDRVSGCE